MISEKLQNAINEQITAEMWSANLYLAMSFYFEKEGFSGFAHWMKKQSQEEMGHAYAMADYIIKRGGTAKVDKIDELSNKVDNLGKELKDFKKEVYQLFEKNTREIATVINQLSESISTKNHRNSEETKQRLEKNDKEHRIYEAQIAKLQLTTQYLEEKGKKLA